MNTLSSLLLFGCIAILSLTIIAIISIVAVSTYMQEKLKLTMNGKATIQADKISSEVSVDLDTKKGNDR